MKKLALFALAALCVTALQAVTINWELDISGKDASGTLKSGGYAGLVVLAGDMTSASAYADLFEVHGDGSQSDSGTNVKVKTLTNVLGVVKNAGDGSSSDNRAELLTSANQWGFYKDCYGDLGTKETVYGTFELTNAEDGFTMILINQYGKAYTAQHYDVTGEGTVTMDLGKLTWVYGESTVLPEPTVFALLALGVAGVALKRKVA